MPIGASSESHRGALTRLVAALAERASAKVVAAALARAIEAAALVPDPDARALIPADPIEPVETPPSWQPWLARGFVPLHCKPSRHTAAQVARLLEVFEIIADGLELWCTPHWIVPGHILSLHLPGAVDLRRPGSPTIDQEILAAEAKHIHAVCLRSLARVVQRDPAFRAALDRAGFELEPFPVAARYRRAVAILDHLTGGVGLSPALLDQVEYGPTTLFWDPKPANFIVPASRRGSWGDPLWPEPVKVDLDLMFTECPVSLQIVLALWAHPVAGSGGAGSESTFLSLRQATHEAATRFGVRADEIDAMLLYHLARNVAWAACGSTPRDVEKFQALTPLLVTAIRQLPMAAARRASVRRLEGLAHGATA